MINSEEMLVGEYRSTVEQFKALYPEDCYDWDKPARGFTDITGGNDWSSEPRLRLTSHGAIDEDEFAITALSCISVVHREDGDLLGLVVNYLSDTCHQSLFFPDDLKLDSFLDSARLASRAVISIPLFETYPLASVADTENVVGSLVKIGLPTVPSSAVAREAAKTTYIMQVLTADAVDPRLLELT